MNKKMFVSFVTAGDPSMEATKGFIEALSKHSDIVEVGLPFSDPVADGAAIQKANIRALENGATTDSMFDMLEAVEFGGKAILCYVNSVFVYGYEKFFERCERARVYGVIIPDLPYEERDEVLPFAKKHNVHLITLIAPTSKRRIAKLAKDATGFIYLVSSLGSTGARTSEFSGDLEGITAEIRKVTDIPICIGFGISTREQVEKMSSIADGVIVGSGFVKIIEEHAENSVEKLENYIKILKGEKDV
ncbi:MAG: tryptophan synthase subunit alpha [Clostridiales Family XIII bacterium]|jgi:tryptophan synthase alpha chain|nr:tryptophan synthase subunit alpha [Clostridiales Family XIII bacterium]